jgi:aspartyl/asparaginyl-tRNA synthetase
MERTLIGDLQSTLGQSVKIQGWLQTLRNQKKMQFLVVRDLTGAVQVVSERAANPVLAALIDTLNVESAITLTGKAIANSIVKLGGIEIQIESLEVNNLAASPLPFDPFGETLPDLDYRLDCAVQPTLSSLRCRPPLKPPCVSSGSSTTSSKSTLQS